MNWNQLNNADQITLIDTESNNVSVLIFKHSTRCSISSTSLNRIESSWKQGDENKLKPYLLDLIRFRAASNAIAEHYGIEHQSPQVLVIKNGRCIYSESHLGISYRTLINAEY